MLFAVEFTTLFIGSLLANNTEFIQEVVEVLGAPFPKKASDAQHVRHEICQERSETLRSCVTLLSQFVTYPSRRLSVIILKDWLRLLKVLRSSPFEWLRPLLATILPGKIILLLIPKLS